jgi:hypothetical protein
LSLRAGATAPAVTVVGFGGAQVRTVLPDGGGPPETEIRFPLAPFVTQTASVLLGAAAGSATAMGEAFQVQARALRSDGVALAEGTSQSVAFGATDVVAEIALACVLPGGCGAVDAGVDAGMPDGGAPDAGPGTITVQGQVLDTAGAPFPGADVLVGGAVLSSDAEGRFTAPAITPPYDLTVKSPGRNAVISWSGATLPSPRAALNLPATPPVDGGASRRMNLGVEFTTFGVNTQAEVIVASPALARLGGTAILLGGYFRRTVPAQPAQQVVSVQLEWDGPPSIEIVIVGAEYAPAAADGGIPDGGPFAFYERLGVARISVSDGLDVTFNLGNRTTGLYADQRVTVNASGAAALGLRRYYPLLDVGGVQVPLPGSPENGYEGSAFAMVPASRIADLCPTGATCTQLVAVLARDVVCTASNFESRLTVGSRPVSGGDVSVPVSLLDPPAVSAPPAVVDAGLGSLADGGPPAAPLAYAFSAAPEYAAHLALIARGGNSHSVWTARESGTFPDLRLLDGGFPPGRYLYLLLSTTDPTYRPDAVLGSARAALPVPGDLCAFGPPLGAPAGVTRAANVRLVELSP